MFDRFVEGLLEGFGNVQKANEIFLMARRVRQMKADAAFDPRRTAQALLAQAQFKNRVGSMGVDEIGPLTGSGPWDSSRVGYTLGGVAGGLALMRHDPVGLAINGIGLAYGAWQLRRGRRGAAMLGIGLTLFGLGTYVLDARNTINAVRNNANDILQGEVNWSDNVRSFDVLRDILSPFS